MGFLWVISKKVKRPMLPSSWVLGPRGRALVVNTDPERRRAGPSVFLAGVESKSGGPVRLGWIYLGISIFENFILGRT